MNKQEITGTIKTVKRLNNSYYGNPNFKLILETENGHAIPVSTLNDYGINYKLGGFLEGKQVTMLVKVNRLSNKLLDINEG